MLHILATLMNVTGFCLSHAKGQQGTSWDFLRTATTPAPLSIKYENYSWSSKIRIEKYFLILVTIREEGRLSVTTRVKSAWLPERPGQPAQLSRKHWYTNGRSASPVKNGRRPRQKSKDSHQQVASGEQSSPGNWSTATRGTSAKEVSSPADAGAEDSKPRHTNRTQKGSPHQPLD